MASPMRGISILMTSAPNSARLATEWGVKMYMVLLIHRMPFRASGLVELIARIEGLLAVLLEGRLHLFELFLAFGAGEVLDIANLHFLEIFIVHLDYPLRP